MKKKLGLLIAVLFIFACGKKTEPVPADITKITVEDFLLKTTELKDKKVEITGTIVHTCQHSGKRAHIIGTDPNKKVKLEVVGEASKFDKEMEGKTVIAEGIVKELIIDEAYLVKWESELKASGASEKNLHEGHKAENEKMSENDENLGKIAAYRKQIKESGKEKLEFYWIDCNKHQIKI
jgi:hypothetical protein